MSSDHYETDYLGQAAAIQGLQGSLQQQRIENTYLVEFFARYTEFTYRRNAPVMAEFNRLCDTLNLDEGAINDARRGLRSAMRWQFNAIYGGNDLEAWRNLCDILNITPVPLGLKECQAVMKTKFVNLIDLVDRQNTGQKVKVFATLKELQDYTHETGKFFPREEAKADGLLKCFLQIMGGTKKKRGGRRRGKGKRKGRGSRGRGRSA